MEEMPDRDDLLFAEHAVKAGFVTQEALDESLGVQRRMEEMGVAESLRNVLVKRGALTDGDALVVARRAGLTTDHEPIPGYVLERRLGTGAMGSVYLALQRSMKRRVAVKILRRDLTDDPRQVERLQREAALVGQLDHPNIVRGLDSGRTGGLIWFAMEYVEGETLQQRIRRVGRLPLDEALLITQRLTEAIHHAHEHGIVHRDIKPGNVLMSREEVPRLTDYGLAKGETDDALTHVDATLGTPQYISPEQARNPRDADIRSDIYSLGATLYAMLAGHPPYSGDTLAEILTKVLYDRPAPLEEEVPGLSREVVYLVQRMMAKDRSHRYRDPAELLKDVKALAAGKLHVPIGFRGDLEEFEQRRTRRRKVVRAVAAVGAAVAIALAAALYENYLTAQERETDSRRSFDAVLAKPGPRDAWDAATVDGMLDAWDEFLQRYPQSSRAEAAQQERAAWVAQSAAIGRVGELALRTDDVRQQGVAGDWLSLLDDYQELAAEFERGEHVDVARARLARALAGAAAARNSHARNVLSRAEEQVAELDLLSSAQVFEEAAETLRRRFHDDPDATQLRTAVQTAAAYREAAARVEAAFEEWEALREGSGPRHFLREREALDRARRLVSADVDLAVLPPRGRRTDAALAVVDRRLAAVAEACEEAWGRVRDAAQEAMEELEFDRASKLLSEFSLRALPAQGTAAAEVAAGLATRRNMGETQVRETVVARRDAYFAELREGRYDAALAELTALEDTAATWPEAYRPSPRLYSGGRELVRVIRELAFEPLRRRLRAGVQPKGGVEFERFRYPVVTSLRLRDGDLVRVYVREDGEPEEHPLSELSFDSLVELSGLDPAARDEGRSALAYLGLRLTRYRPHARTRRPLQVLDPLGPLLDRLRRVEDLDVIAAELTRLRDLAVEDVERRTLAAEANAQRLHREAREAFDRRDYLDAVARLTRLLDEREYYRTQYVADRRKLLTAEREQAERAHEVRGFERSFPGTDIVGLPAGRSSILFDFDDPEQAEAWTLAPGRTELRFRERLVTALPATVHPGSGGPLLTNGYLAWTPWTGEAETHPRHFPLTLPIPFETRGRIEISFLYRSRSPYFLLLSIGGVNAGILSAPDDREGGQGTLLWQGDGLREPDKVFDARHRADWVAEHPDTTVRQRDGRYFHFEPDRWYRVRLVKDSYRAELFVDGRSIASEPVRTLTGEWSDRFVLISYTSGEVDDFELSGTLDAEWLNGR